ncbi:MAG: Thiamin ABC transporter, transmembrane component [uncultured Nocardioidaceae bacterium]|uniref:Thiamin ABC transporter, transmembrane component n=1 Tax=uncultured Nocardioidaceae bacterium TaxID=253824 RepID=A0A6J4MV16_9ACTN|nr:MAG: Thiamin ABC transporter, transmembrane component [uncultured Nocardioidaceae bacterium]
MSGRRYLALGVVAGAVPLAVLLVFFALPVAGMLQRGFFPDGRLDLDGAAAALWRPRVGQAVWFTAWSASAATALTVALGVPTAFVLHRLRFPGQRLLRGLVVAPFVLPTVVVGVAFRTLLSVSGPLGGLGLDGTPAAIVAALVFFNVSVVVRTVGPWWEGMDPRREEAAAALGASPVRVLTTVTLPALRPAIVSAASVVFLFSATAFGVVLTMGGVRYSTVETEIYLLTTQFLDLQAAAALCVLQIVVVVGLLAVAGRTGAGRDRPVDRADRRTTNRRPALRDLPALGVTGVVVLLVTLPLATLVVRSLRVDGTWSLAFYRRLQQADSTEAYVVPLSTALSNSLRVAFDATLLAVTLGTVVAVLVTRRVAGPVARRTLSAFDGVFMLPLGVSAVTVGFGLLVTLDRPPFDFRGSPWLVPVAQAMVALPLVVRTVVPALRGVDDRQREAAASLGASPLRVLASVDLAVAWRPLLAATGFAFAVSLGEFGATSFLARPDTPTLPVMVYQLISQPGGEGFGGALAASVVLGLVTSVVMAGVERTRVPGAGAF